MEAFREGLTTFPGNACQHGLVHVLADGDAAIAWSRRDPRLLRNAALTALTLNPPATPAPVAAYRGPMRRSPSSLRSSTGTLVQTREAIGKIFARTNAAFALGVAKTLKNIFKLLEQTSSPFFGTLAVTRLKPNKQQPFPAQLDADYMPAFVPERRWGPRLSPGNFSLTVVRQYDGRPADVF